MATIRVAFGGAMNGAPVMVKAPTASANLTTGGSSAATSIEAREGEFAFITSYNANCIVVAGSAPVASASNGYGLQYGATITIGPLKAGDKVAAIDATVA